MAGDITTFAKDYPKALHVVTCRIAAFPEITGVDMSSLAKFTIDDMDENQRRDFIHKWYRARASQWKGENVDNLADRLIEKIETSIRILAVNPLLLTIMAIIYSDLRNLPDTRLRLYEECVHVLMHRRDEATGLPDVQRFISMMPQPEYILGELGYGLHKDSETLGSGIAEPPREDIYNRIVQIIIERRKVDDDYKRDAIRNRDVHEFCRFIEERTSILVDRGMGRYGFVHQTFQEYFAAYYLNTIWDVEELWSEIKDKIWNQYWWEVLLLLSEMLARRGDVLNVLLEKIIEETEELKGVPSPLLLLADIVIQGTPVTDVFKSRVLESLYETCFAYGEVSGSFADRLEKLGDHGLNEETYTLLEKDIGGASDERRLWAIRYFSLRNDLIESYIDLFGKSVEPYINDSKVRESLLPLLGELKHLAAPILRFTDLGSMITPCYMDRVLLFYHRYLMENKQFAEPNYVLRKLSAGVFVCSARLTFFTLVPDPVRALDLALDLTRARYPNLNLAKARGLAWDLALITVRNLSLERFRGPIVIQTLAQNRTQAQNRVQTQAIAMIDAEPLFHGAMIHTATLIEILSEEGEELPFHLAYALEKPIDPEIPYLRAAQLFRRFIRREITPEEEGEFQRLLNIEDEEIRHLFDLAHLTEPQTREPIFRFSIGDRDEDV